MTQKEIIKIKKEGYLLAIRCSDADSHQYWMRNDIIYCIQADGTNGCYWCSEHDLDKHLRHLFYLTGQKAFTDDKFVSIIDTKGFLKNYKYA